MSSIWNRIRQISSEAKAIFQENITHWFVVQIFYVIHDRRHGNFKNGSEHFDQAQENYNLLVNKNIIIVALILTPLILIPIPGTAEIWLYFYCNIVNKLSPQYKQRLAFEFQKRADMPPEDVLQDIQTHITEGINVTKKRIKSIKPLNLIAKKRRSKNPPKDKQS